MCRAPRCWMDGLQQHEMSSPRGIGVGARAACQGPALLEDGLELGAMCGAQMAAVWDRGLPRKGSDAGVAMKRRRLMHGMGRGLA
jgi:hypothetical protein